MNQPVSITAYTVRECVLGAPTATYVWQSLAWSAGITLVFVVLGVWRYRRPT
jgi:hypothetical protein